MTARSPVRDLDEDFVGLDHAQFLAGQLFDGEKLFAHAVGGQLVDDKNQPVAASAMLVAIGLGLLVANVVQPGAWTRIAAAPGRINNPPAINPPATPCMSQPI